MRAGRASSCSSSRRSGRALPQRRATHASLATRRRDLHRQVGEAEHRFGRAGLGGACAAARTASRYACVPNSASLPSPTSSTRSAGTFGDVVQEQRRAELAFHVAALQQFAQRTARGAIERVRRGRELARFEHADDDAGRGGVLRREDFYAKFHARLRGPSFAVRHQGRLAIDLAIGLAIRSPVRSRNCVALVRRRTCRYFRWLGIPT